MKAMNVSLLWPSKEEETLPHSILTKTVVTDLNLDVFCKCFMKNETQFETIKSVMTELVSDCKTIRYRQDVFGDIVSSPALADALKKILSDSNSFRIRI